MFGNLKEIKLIIIYVHFFKFKSILFYKFLCSIYILGNLNKCPNHYILYKIANNGQLSIHINRL